jgi:phytoene dehydrogenase-like protein
MRTSLRPSNRYGTGHTHRRRRIAPTTVIVGAGIAGLTIAERLLAAGADPANILLLEKYDYVGGRIVSHRDGYEIGAGRIHESHRHVGALIDRFGLTRIPLGGSVTWMPLGASRPIPNHFEADMRSMLRHLPVPDGSTTLRQLLRRHMPATDLHDLLEKFPYRAETEVLRSDLALQSFRPRGEMGSHADFFVVKEGLAAIVRGLRDQLTAAGVRIALNTEVTHVGSDGSLRIRGRQRPMRPGRTVLALHATALQRILPTEAARPLHRFLRMEPLTRIYAAYPPDHPWTRRITSEPPIVTDSPLRYVIPVNPTTGIIMISYTEGRDCRRWHGLKGAALQTEIQKEVRRLWPTEAVPEPMWVRPYEWTEGCTYWRPGRYDPASVAAALQHPYPTVWVAGESLSVGRQAWIEGALEVAHAVSDRILSSI